MQPIGSQTDTSAIGVINRQILITALWFLKVRWLAVAALLVAGVAANWLSYQLTLAGVTGVALYLAVANVLFIRYSRRLELATIPRVRLKWFVNLQIGVDWLAVLALVYLTGGACSPCTLFFVFHILMASILLPARHILFQATIAVVLLGLLFLLEGVGLVGHRQLIEGLLAQVHTEPRFVLAVYGILVLTIYAAILLGNWVGQLLRRRMRQLFNAKNHLEDANQHLQAIFEVMRMLGTSREIEDLLATIAQQATHLWGIQAAFIVLMDPNTQSLNFAATHGLDDSHRPDKSNPYWAVHCLNFLQNDETVFKDDLTAYRQRDDFPILQWLAKQGLQSMMIMPLRVEKVRIGGFCLASQHAYRFNREDSTYFKIFADLVSIQIETVRANQALLSHARTRSWFFNKVAHDLRAPMAAVRSLLSVISDGYVHDLEQVKVLVTRASRRVEGLTDMVNDLLLLAQDRFDSLEPSFEEVDVSQVLVAVIQLHEVEVENKQVTISFFSDPDIPPVRATENGIERIATNLLSNAIKYTPRGGQIDVSLRNIQGRYLLVRIIDTGIGIPKDAQKHIFEEFYRAPNAKKLDEVGTGLGLSIAKRFVENFGGQLTFESEEGHGTTFSFFLPTTESMGLDVKAIGEELGWRER